jgi:CubicO group peptidase (beta-lactamase class C family)
VDFVRQPAPALRDKSYGGLFWLNAGGRYKNIPRDAYWPAGHHGQTVMIVPSRDLVVVRLGHSIEGGSDAYMAAVMDRILAAIDAPQ